jgi:hypothetical protein
MKLDTKKPVGNGVQAPSFHSGSTGIIPNRSADMSGGHGINMSYDQTNLSAKFKNPRVKQDIPSAARNQYE